MRPLHLVEPFVELLEVFVESLGHLLYPLQLRERERGLALPRDEPRGADEGVRLRDGGGVLGDRGLPVAHPADGVPRYAEPLREAAGVASLGCKAESKLQRLRAIHNVDRYLDLPLKL